MEADKPQLYDEDLDDNGDKKQDEDKKEEEKKKPKKPLLKLDPTFLIEQPRGLKSLYKRVVVDKQRNLSFKGKGHELSDLNKLMTQLKGWHFEAMPKFEISYFADRMAKVGNDKDVKQFLNKLRLVHKGLEVLDEFQGEEEATAPAVKGPAPKGTVFEYINTSTAPFDDYASFCKTNNQQPAQPFFKMMDLPQGQTQNYQES